MTDARSNAIWRPARRKRWVVYAKPPFAGPEAVLAYLSRYTHRVAISNRRLISFDEAGVTFRYKDYRRDGDDRHRTMTLAGRRVHPPLSAARPARASTASATTVCSPAAAARPTSRAPANFSRSQRSGRRTPDEPSDPRPPVPAAAAA